MCGRMLRASATLEAPFVNNERRRATSTGIDDELHMRPVVNETASRHWSGRPRDRWTEEDQRRTKHATTVKQTRAAVEERCHELMRR